MVEISLNWSKWNIGLKIRLVPRLTCHMLSLVYFHSLEDLNCKCPSDWTSKLKRCPFTYLKDSISITTNATGAEQQGIQSRRKLTMSAACREFEKENSSFARTQRCTVSIFICHVPTWEEPVFFFSHLLRIQLKNASSRIFTVSGQAASSINGCRKCQG